MQCLCARDRVLRTVLLPWLVVLSLIAILLPSAQPAHAAATPQPSVITNLALGKTAQADSTASSSTMASLAVDGDNEYTFWQSANTTSDHWLSVDLAATYTVSRVLFWSGGTIPTYTIQYWDGSTWVNVSNQTTPTTSSLSGTSISLAFVEFSPVATSEVRFYDNSGAQATIYNFEVYAYNPQPVYVNQVGYDIGKSKRFTAPNADASATFSIEQVGSSTPLFSGSLVNQVGDFTSFDTAGSHYVIVVNGTAGTGQSVPFAINTNLIEQATYQQALNFMEESMCGDGDYSSRTGSGPGCSSTGLAWRDAGPQFSYLIRTLLDMYLSNPSAWARLSGPAVFKNLPDGLLPSGTPDIVKLIYWAVEWYITPYGASGDAGRADHPLLKEDLAYFIWAYPQLSQWIPQSVYTTARDYLFRVWSNTDKSRWYTSEAPTNPQLTEDGNLLQTYTIYDTSGKGAFPPGNSIVPNLLMYEVAQRDNETNPGQYLTAAVNNAQWVMSNIDWATNTVAAKGQRLSESITIKSLAYLLKNYPAQAPAGLLSYITTWANTMIGRSNNEWDFRMYSSTQWTILNGYNEPGNVAGFPGAAFAACQVIIDATICGSLRRIAMAQIDDMFGRNPTGRAFSHDAVGNFPGVQAGWYSEFRGGYGQLEPVSGVLDGSPKNASYPYSPDASPGYTEGWVSFNTPWNSSLGYMAADVMSLQGYDSTFSSTITQISPGTSFGVQLQAPLNLDPNSVETGTVQITTSGGDALQATVSEVSANDNRFRAVITTASGPVNTSDNILQVQPGDTITISYGYGTFCHQATLKVPLFSDNFESGSASQWTPLDGSWSVVSDSTFVYKQTSTTGEALAVAGSTGWTNYTVSADVKLYDINSTAGSGVVARYRDANNFYMLRLHASGALQLYKKVGGTFTLLASASTSVAINTVYTLSLSLNGSALTGLLNGTALITFTDTSLSSGEIGLRTFTQTTSFDNILVTAP